MYLPPDSYMDSNDPFVLGFFLNYNTKMFELGKEITIQIQSLSRHISTTKPTKKTKLAEKIPFCG